MIPNFRGLTALIFAFIILLFISTILFAHNPPLGCCCECRTDQESNTSPCYSKPAHLGGDLGGCSGNIYTERGEFYQRVTDLSIPGRPGAEGMLHYAFLRHYRSRLNADSPIGRNWFHNYFERLVVIGARVAHDSIDRSDNYFRGAQAGTFISPPELFTVLTQDQTARTFQLRYPGGTVKSFDANGQLSRIADRKGNFMTFEYDANRRLTRVVDTLGRAIVYRYIIGGVNNGKLFEIEDFIGRKVQFKYDNNNDLTEVSSPAVTGTPTGNNFPDGKTTRYTYSSGFSNNNLNHNLLTITRPNEVANGGQPVLINEYGEVPGNPHFDRIIRQTYGGLNASGVAAGGNFNYEYFPRPNTEDPVFRARETDRNGNVEEYEFNLLGYPTVRREFTRGLRTDDPPVFETLMEYNDDGQLTRMIYPEGNSVEYTYDGANPDRLAQGNLLMEKRISDLDRGEDQTVLITTYTYETRFNQVKSITDPRGNDPGFEPPNGGATSPGRYTTTFTFDYEVPGDPVLNPEGFEHGNIVRKQEPTVRLLDGSLQQIITEYNYNLFGQQIREIDPEGNVDESFYFPESDPDGDGNPTPLPGLNTETGGYLKEQIIDSTVSPRRTEPSPPAQISHQWFYDPVGNVIRSIDGRGNDTLFFVNQLNQVVRTQSEAPFRYIKDTIYDFNDNVIEKRIENKVARTVNGKPVFTGDGNFQVGQETPRFFVHRYTFDILDNLVKKDEDAAGSTPSRLITNYLYDANENRTQEIFSEGNIFSDSYDERDLLFTRTRGFGSPEASTFTYSYDGNRNQIIMLDGEDNNGDGKNDETIHQYDGFDRLFRVIDAVGNRLIKRYDPNSNIVRESHFGRVGGPSPADNGGSGNVLLSRRFYKHDELNRIFQQDDLLFISPGVSTVRVPQLIEGPLTPGDNRITMRFLYDRNSRKLQEIEDDLATTTIEYDGVDRMVKKTDGESNLKSYTYDDNNNVIETVQTELSQKTGVTPEMFTTTNQYDTLDRLTRTTDNCGNTDRYAYDSRNNLTHLTDAKDLATLGCPGTINEQGNSMRYAYDGINRRIREVRDLRVGGIGSGAIDTSNPFNPDGRITTIFAWDGNNRLMNLVDDNGNLTLHSFDAINRLKMETFADGTTKEYTYDHDDNLVSYKDNNGTIQNCLYDAINRQVRCELIRAQDVVGTTLLTYEYDGLSRRRRLIDNNDPSVPQDDSNVVMAYDSVSRMLEEVQNNKAITSDWFANEQRVGLTYPNDRKIILTFDNLDRLKTIEDEGAVENIVQYNYIGPERVLEREYANGVRLTYLDNAGTTDIGYDRVKRIVSQRQLRADNSMVVGFNHAYDREDNKRFEEKLHDLPHSEQYSYDSPYRIIDFQRGQIIPAQSSLATVQQSQSWNLDGLGNWRVNTVDGVPENRTVNQVNEYVDINTTAQVHDPNGNLIDDGTLIFRWDGLNRLRSVFRKSDDTLISTFSYDAANRRIRKILTNLGTMNGTTDFFYDGWRVLEEKNGADDALLQQYVYGVYIDEVLVLDRNLDGDNSSTGPNDQRLFYHENTQYSIHALTNTNAAVVEGYHYDAYGTPSGLSTVGNPYMFTGQRFESETGLYYYKYRYMDPVKGRFISRDLIPYVDNINLYLYGQSNPPNINDTFGLGGLCCTGVGDAIRGVLESFAKLLGLTEEELLGWEKGGNMLLGRCIYMTEQNIDCPSPGKSLGTPPPCCCDLVTPPNERAMGAEGGKVELKLGVPKLGKIEVKGEISVTTNVGAPLTANDRCPKNCEPDQYVYLLNVRIAGEYSVTAEIKGIEVSERIAAALSSPIVQCEFNCGQDVKKTPYWRIK